MLSIRLSIYCCNYVASEHGQLLLSFNSMDQIVHEIRHTNPPLALGARTEKSRKVAVEETSQKKPSTSTSTATTSSGRIITTGVRTSEEDDVLIKSLVEHLDSYDRYIKHLEKNPKKVMFFLYFPFSLFRIFSEFFHFLLTNFRAEAYSFYFAGNNICGQLIFFFQKSQFGRKKYPRHNYFN